MQLGPANFHHQQQHHSLASKSLGRLDGREFEREYAKTISRMNKLQQQASNNQINGKHQNNIMQQHNNRSFAYQASPLPLQLPAQIQLDSATAGGIQASNYYAPSGEPSVAHLRRELQLGSRPLCRCRVMYLGSAVPHKTKNGLHGIQDPLKSLYPEEQFQKRRPLSNELDPMAPNMIDISHLSAASMGIDSWLSVWTNGLLLENVDEFGREIKRFFSIESLHYCAAVRFFDTTTLTGDFGIASLLDRPSSCLIDQKSPTSSDQNNNNGDGGGLNLMQNNNEIGSNSDLNSEEEERRFAKLGEQSQLRKSAVKFLPLDAPLFQCPGMLDASHPPVFAAILRRTSGIKVLECHSFICRRDAAANALVRCCTYAYADLIAARRLSMELETRQGNTRRSQANLVRPYSSSSCHRRRSRNGAGSEFEDDEDEEEDEEEQEEGQQHIRAQVHMFNGDPDANGKYFEGSAAIQEQKSHCRTFKASSSHTTEPTSSSSDDNYAIIARRNTTNHQLDLAVKPQQPENGANLVLDSSGNNKIINGKSKGSSRSLFSDFQPNGSAGKSDQNDSEKRMTDGTSPQYKLSHSLDLITRTESPQINCTKVQDSSSASQQAKRHSKSMQNLGRSSSTSGTVRDVGSERIDSGTTKRASRHSRQSQRSNNSKRRSASYTDFTSLEMRQTAEFLAVPSQQQDPPREKLPKQQQQRVTSEPPRVAPPGNLHNHHHKSASKRSAKSSKSAIGIGQAVKTSRHESGSATMARLRRRDQSVSSSGHYEQLYHQPPGPHPQYLTNAPYGSPAALMAPVPPPHLHNRLPYHNHHQPAYHSAGQQQLVHHHHNYPQILYAHPFAQQAHLHPAHYQHQLHPYSAHFGQHQLAPLGYQQPSAGSSSSPLMSFLQQRADPMSSKRRTTLARFRCLSPPANLLPSRSLQLNGARAQQAMQQGNSRPPSAHLNGLASSPISDASINGLEVITAAPPFRNNSKQHEQEAMMLQNGQRTKRLSWIKRLSLSLQSGDSGSQHSDQSRCDKLMPLPVSQQPPNQQVNGQEKENKRRSRLFSGSLTLGRSNKRKAKKEAEASAAASAAAAGEAARPSENLETATK